MTKDTRIKRNLNKTYDIFSIQVALLQRQSYCRLYSKCHELIIFPLCFQFSTLFEHVFFRLQQTAAPSLNKYTLIQDK